MNFPFFISRRISLSSEGSRKLSPAIGVGITSVALAVLIMASAISIVTGFKKEITSKVTGFNSDITISIADYRDDSDTTAYTENSKLLSLTPTLRSILDEAPFVDDYAIQATIPAILKTSKDFKGAYLKSFTGRNLHQFIAGSIEDGHIPDFDSEDAKYDILISRAIASKLHLKAGDKIDTYFITDRLLVRSLNISGIYNSHFDIYDDVSIYGSLPLVQELAQLNATEGTAIVISTDNFDNVEEYTATLQNRLIDEYTNGRVYHVYQVTNARNSGVSYFHWLGMLDTNVLVILTLMTIVAIVSLISGMYILMVDKIRLIALLSALGASRKMIGRIFVYLSARIALIGLLIGDALAIGFLYLQKSTHFLPLDPDSYYIDYVPVEISPLAIIILNIVTLIIIFASLLLPSRYAGKTTPARTLSQE